MAELAGVSVRTLRYYDQIGLLKPQEIGKNRYRYYVKPQLLQLQQVLFYRELGFNLDEIKYIIQKSDFDLEIAMEAHRASLLRKSDRIQTLIKTVDNTLSTLKGKKSMAQNEYFNGFSEEKQAEYQKYAETHWDKKLVKQSVQRWNSLSKEGKELLMAEGSRITMDIVKTIPLGPESLESQAKIAEWHQYINNFFDCSYEILLGLGRAYNEHPDFLIFYQKIHPEMPEFLFQAIKAYCAKSGVSA